MFATISFSITLLGLFSIIDISRGNQKFGLLKYYILARLMIITVGSSMDYLGLTGYEIPYYKEIFKIIALLVTVNLFFLIVQKRIPKQVIWIEIFFITFFIVELIFGIETPIIKQGVLQNKPILFHQIFFGLYAFLGSAALFYNTYYLFVAKKTQVNLYELKIKKWVGFYILSNIILVLISIFLFRSFQNGTLGVYDNTMITVFIHRFLFIFFILIRPKFLDDDKLATKDTAAMLRFYTKTNYIDSSIRIKLNASDTIKYTKQLYSDSALLTKMNVFDTSIYAKQLNVDAALSTKFNNTDTIYYTKKNYVDSALLTIPSLTSLTSLNTVGTITSGIWSATTLDIAHGGTGLTTAGLTGQALTTTVAGTLTWTNVLTSGVHSIGESYGGGIVFYVYDNGKHGLIAATSDQILNTRWYGGSYTNTRARADGVGAGLKNTSIIIAVQSGTYSPTYDGASFAAAVCNEYTVTIDGVTYGDWYLPSKHELNLLFLQRAIVGNFPNISGSYWSSTEYFRSDLVGSYQLAWYQNFVTGAQAYLNKKNTWSVRAIRAF